MAEETTLEKMEKVIGQRDEAGRWLEETNKALKGLAAGTQANIDGMVVRLGGDGQVSMSRNDPPEAFTVSERQFLGLMGWGRKHVGNGPDGKSKDEP